MTSDKKRRWSNRIPIRFVDSDEEQDTAANTDEAINMDEKPEAFPQEFEMDEGIESGELDYANYAGEFVDPGEPQRADTGELGGPEVAELVATRSELKRVEAEAAELKDRLARRQADFENYRKRVERERGDTFNRVVADVVSKLLPVLDNLKRALETEASVEASESDEFRHFLSGVDLIYRQLDGVVDGLGVKPIAAVGEKFDPHLHEAVVTEETDEYEPETVMQEIVKGYRLGDKLIRPSMVKVAVKK